ncbi:MAG: hypothetical protein KAW39_02300 [Thermoplasmata archaeon]|nr:hypothetical protein [Thermoplasmata archaeon]
MYKGTRRGLERAFWLSAQNTRHWTHIALSMSMRVMSIFFPASVGMNPRQVPISKMLRHTSIETTQRYHARIRSEVAFEGFERIWEAPTISVQEPRIDSQPSREVRAHGSPFRGKKVKKLEEIATSSSFVAKNPLGDRMFYYLNKTDPTHPMRP